MSMIENRELTMDDYLAIVRRRLKVVLIPLLMAPLAGYLVSHAFSPKYTAQTTVLVEGQRVPDNMVQSMVVQDVGQRIQFMRQTLLAANRLRPILEQAGIPAEEQGRVVKDVQQNLTLDPMPGDIAAAAAQKSGGSTTAKRKPTGNSPSIAGFYVDYTSSNAQQAQRICNEFASALTLENLRTRVDIVKGTTDFLGQQVKDAKQALDEVDQKLADFKKEHSGQLPSDQDTNVKMLISLNSQLDATTQTLGRAQQDKTYTESMLSQQIAAWKASQSTTNPQTLEQQLTNLQAQLLQLQARYTPDHPDVIKTKADIASVQKKLDEVNAAAGKATDTTEKANVSEPAEIRQLRLQIHQYEQVIAQSTADQKKLQSAIELYRSRSNVSPTVEGQYDQLQRDRDNAQKVYLDLLSKKSATDVSQSMESQQQGEQMIVIAPPGAPDSPSFPNRLYFAGGGLGAGLALGIALAVWLEVRDKAIRTEKDAAAAMDLPLLVSVPWVVEEEVVASNGKRRFWQRRDGGSEAHLHQKIEI